MKTLFVVALTALSLAVVSCAKKQGAGRKIPTTNEIGASKPTQSPLPKPSAKPTPVAPGQAGEMVGTYLSSCEAGEFENSTYSAQAKLEVDANKMVETWMYYANDNCEENVVSGENEPYDSDILLQGSETYSFSFPADVSTGSTAKAIDYTEVDSGVDYFDIYKVEKGSGIIADRLYFGDAPGYFAVDRAKNINLDRPYIKH